MVYDRRGYLWLCRNGFVLAIVGTVAACIAAVPVIQSWMPVSLTEKEKEILKESMSNPKMPGVLLYWFYPISEQGNQTVNAPYVGNHIEVESEILNLRDKGLIRAMDRMPEQHPRSICYQLTSSGYRIAKSMVHS